MSTIAGDPYPRPDRDEIARRVKASLPPPPALECFASHLSARMRVLGWDQADLQAKAEISSHVASKALNGTGVELGTAEKIASVVGRELPYMLMPYQCTTCLGAPPKGFACLECGTEARA